MTLDDPLERLFQGVPVEEGVTNALLALSKNYGIEVVKGYVQEWLVDTTGDSETMYPYYGSVEDDSATNSCGVSPKCGINERPIPFEELKGMSAVSTGNFGAVHKGTYQASDIAVKTLHSRYSMRMQERFLQEIAILRRFRHQNIVTYYGYSTRPDGMLCLVMEYCHGGSLMSALRNRCETGNRLCVSDIIRITTHVCSALHSLHCAGVIHRDTAVRNIFLQSPGGITNSQIYKVGDLGLSEDESPVTTSAESSCEVSQKPFHVNTAVQENPSFSHLSLLGSLAKASHLHLHVLAPAVPLYNYEVGECVSSRSFESVLPIRWCSPEVLESKGSDFSAESDIWALGVMLWEIITYASSLPYQTESQSSPSSSIRDSIVNGSMLLEMPVECPRYFWEAVVAPCLLPVKRRPNAAEVRKVAMKLLRTIGKTHSHVIPLPSDQSSFDDFINDKHPMHTHPLKPLTMAVERGFSRYICLVCRNKVESASGSSVRMCKGCKFYMCDACFMNTKDGLFVGEVHGSIVNGKLQGNGVLKCWHGVYEGFFESGEFCKGLFKYKSSNWTYEGQWNGFAKHGHGVDKSNETFNKSLWKGGSTYVGDFEWNMRSGVGRMVWPYMQIYEGEWRADQRHGKGTYTFAPARDISEFNPFSPEWEGNPSRQTQELEAYLLDVPRRMGTCSSCGVKNLLSLRWFKCNHCPCDICLSCFNQNAHPQHTFTSMAKLARGYPWGGEYTGSFHESHFNGTGTLKDKSGAILKQGHWSRGVFAGSMK